MVSIWPARWPAFAGRDELFVEIVGSFDVLAKRSVVDPFADPVYGRQAVQAVPVVEALPFRQSRSRSWTLYAKTGNRYDAGTSKTRITEPYIMLEAKGIDPIRLKNRMVHMISSNEASIVPADVADRWGQIFELGDRKREDRAYFSALSKQLDEGGREAMLHAHLTRDSLDC
ncbi:MAG: primase-helicase family protein [Pseudomonadota bacterium]